MPNEIKSLDDLIELINKNNITKITIKAVAGSKNNSIEFLDEFIKIKINQKAIEGKANKAIVEFLSKTLSIPKSNIKIVNGEKCANKVIQIFNDNIS